MDDGRWFFEKKGRSKFTVRSRSGCLTRYNIYIYISSSRTYSVPTRTCACKRKKNERPPCRPGNWKFRLTSSISILYQSYVPTSPIRVYTRVYTRQGRWKNGVEEGTRSRFQRCNQCNNGDSGSEDRARHNVPLTCLYSCTEREKKREVVRGEASTQETV